MPAIGPICSRRSWLTNAVGGFGSLALAQLLPRERLAAEARIHRRLCCSSSPRKRCRTNSASASNRGSSSCRRVVKSMLM